MNLHFKYRTTTVSRDIFNFYKTKQKNKNECTPIQSLLSLNTFEKCQKIVPMFVCFKGQLLLFLTNMSVFVVFPEAVNLLSNYLAGAVQDHCNRIDLQPIVICTKLINCQNIRGLKPEKPEKPKKQQLKSNLGSKKIRLPCNRGQRA